MLSRRNPDSEIYFLLCTRFLNIYAKSTSLFGRNENNFLFVDGIEEFLRQGRIQLIYDLVLHKRGLFIFHG